MRQTNTEFLIPKAPKSIQKGILLKNLVGDESISCLAHNISIVYSDFDVTKFKKTALENLEPLTLLERADHVAKAMHTHLPPAYSDAINIILMSLTPPLAKTADTGLEVFFYLPHVCFVATYGIDSKYNGNNDPFDISMKAQYEITQRFSAEFSIRYFLIHDFNRTMSYLEKWIHDKNPHVRRLCCEGTRPRLPWAIRLPMLIRDPTAVLPILVALRDDEELYVRRSVANHLGDIAKDHPELVFQICKDWLADASDERKWILRHAVRYFAKKNDKRALQIRELAN